MNIIINNQTPQDVDIQQRFVEGKQQINITVSDIFSWINDYIGIPFVAKGSDHDGCSCYGLIRLIKRERHGIDLPAHLDCYEDIVKDKEVIAERVNHVKGDWDEVPAGEEHPEDVILIRARGLPIHMGMVIGGGEMIHTERGCNSVIVSYRPPEYHPSKLLGFYRYAD